MTKNNCHFTCMYIVLSGLNVPKMSTLASFMNVWVHTCKSILLERHMRILLKISYNLCLDVFSCEITDL